MAYLMHIGFDNGSRFRRNVYYFEYKGIRYKLIQNNVRRWCDVLLSILPTDDKKSVDNAYSTASEFLSALSWQNNTEIKMWLIGGRSFPNRYGLRRATCSMFSFSRTVSHGRNSGHEFIQIPQIETEEQKLALLLFRDALSSNHDYLAFLLFWQVLETGGNDPIGWINKAYRQNRDRIRLIEDDYNNLPLNGKDLGRYLYDDCRNAIAHIRRKVGKVRLKLDTAEDSQRISLSNYIVEKFARFYIKTKLNLRKTMYLVRKNGKGFPVFVGEECLDKYRYTIAYENLSFEQLHKRS